MRYPSLSVVLPVHNAEQTVSGKVTELLEILPDLTPAFEILIINDASTDQTEEVIHELAIIYPQILLARHLLRRGRQGAVETGLKLTSGDILIVQDEEAAIDSSKLHRLWNLRDDDQLFLAAEPRMRQSLMQRLAAWGVRLEESQQNGRSVGVQMIRRQELAGALAEVSAAPASPNRDPGRASWNEITGGHELQARPKFRSVQRHRQV